MDSIPDSSRSIPTCSLPTVASMPRVVNSNPLFSPIALKVPPEPQMIRWSSLTSDSLMCSERPTTMSSSDSVCTSSFDPCIHLGELGEKASA